MINFDDLATLFTRLTSTGTPVAEALRRVFIASKSGRKLTAIQRDEMRQRRILGARLGELAADYHITEVHAGRICKGIKRPLNAQLPLPVVVARVRLATAQEFGLLPDDANVWEGRVGPESADLRARRRAAALVLRDDAQLSFPLIAKALRRKDHTTVMYLVDSARRDPAAREAAQRIRERLGAMSGEWRAA